METRLPPAPPHSQEPKRSPQPVAGRGATTGQPFPLNGDRRSVRPIPALVLTSILDHRPNLHDRLAANDRAYREAERRTSGGRIGLAIMFAVTLVIALMLATGGRF
jgi:hypothetical protein